MRKNMRKVPVLSRFGTDFCDVEQRMRGKTCGNTTHKPILKLRRCKERTSPPLPQFITKCLLRTKCEREAVNQRSKVVGANPPLQKKNMIFFEWSDSLWAMTGKQCWRCGVIREHGYGARVLAHFRSHKGCCLLQIAGRWS